MTAIQSLMLKPWCSLDYLQSVIDQIAPEYHRRGHSKLIDQLHTAARNKDLQLASALEQRAFTELHSVPWDQVWSQWRTMYTISLLVQICNHRGSQSQLLELIDRALIFGDELCRRNLTSYAEEISGNLAGELDDMPVYIDDSIVYDVSYSGVCPSLAKSVVRLKSCDPFRFYREFVSAGIPVVIEGLINSWPSLNARSFRNVTYLKKKMAFRTVIIESGRDYQSDPNWRPLLMTIGEFIDSSLLTEQNTGSILYLAQNDLFDQVPELAADISAPDYIEFDPALVVSDDVDSDLVCRVPQARTSVWFGPAGTLSPLHTDPQNNILCQVFGYKYVRLFPDSAKFRNQKEAGDISEQTYFETRLTPGDSLFIPKGMWHHVESLSRSFSVNFWWTHSQVE